MRRHMCGSVSNQRGVGLIEVLVTVLILSTSLLAMGALQNRSLQFNHSAYLRSQANVMAYDILDRVRINRGNLASYEHELDEDKPAIGGSLADRDLNEWLTAIERNLPGGAGAIECNAQRVCTVTLEWIERDSAAAEGEAEGAQETTTFTYSTRI